MTPLQVYPISLVLQVALSNDFKCFMYTFGYYWVDSVSWCAGDSPLPPTGSLEGSTLAINDAERLQPWPALSQQWHDSLMALMHRLRCSSPMQISDEQRCLGAHGWLLAMTSCRWEGHTHLEATPMPSLLQEEQQQQQRLIWCLLPSIVCTTCLHSSAFTHF